MKILSYCKALADETRVRLLNILIHYELNVGELVAVMGMGQSRISRHLKVLTESGLLASRRDGLWVFYKAVTSEPGASFISGLNELLAREPILQSDLEQAAKVVEERAAATKNFFDSIAPEWDRLCYEILGDLEISSKIIDRLPYCHVALDLGCGPGELISSLLIKSETVIGVDNSPKMLEEAAKRFAQNQNVSLRIGEVEHLPLREKEADCAVMSMVLHHLLHPKEALQETYRVLTPQAPLLIVDFKKHEDEKMRKQHGDRWLGFQEEEVKGWLEESGFRVQEAVNLPAKQGLEVLLFKSIKIKTDENL